MKKGKNEDKVMKNVHISKAALKGLELAVDMNEGGSAKHLIERAAEKYAHPFIKEIAEEQGMTLKEFIAACERGEL